MTATADLLGRDVFKAFWCAFAVAVVCGCAAEPRSRPTSGDPGSRDITWVSCTTNPPAPDAFRRVDRLLVQTRAAQEVPGMAVGVVCGDTLAYAMGYGVRSVDDSTPVTLRTLFRVASITKVFTATAIMKLEEVGALRRGDPVQEHLPWFALARPPATGEAPVTVQHLLTHTAGMPRDSRLTDFDRRLQPERGEAIAALPDQQLESAPGERYAYSNLGYAVLGQLIAEKAGTPYAEYMRREILEPLGMVETRVHPGRDDRVARGHGPRGPDGSRSLAGFWELRFATPAGGMASSVAELSEFVELQLAPYLGREPAVLSTHALRTMHRLHFVMDSTRGGSGLGWGVEISRDQHLIYHGGELPEQTAFVLIDLRTHLGIILLTNAQGVDANGLAQEILRIVRRAVFGPEGRFPREAIPPAPP